VTQINRKEEWRKRHRRVRKKVFGTKQRPRLCVTKSLRHVYVQLIDDERGHTLVAASTLDPEVRDGIAGCGISAAVKVGEVLAQRARKKGIKTVVFDRGGCRYHGVFAALAKASREGGLEF
jgi:large subunit ribosomal protein L18